MSVLGILLSVELLLWVDSRKCGLGFTLIHAGRVRLVWSSRAGRTRRSRRSGKEGVEVHLQKSRHVHGEDILQQRHIYRGGNMQLYSAY